YLVLVFCFLRFLCYPLLFIWHRLFPGQPRSLGGSSFNQQNMYKVKIFSIAKVTHNVRRFRFEKPEGYHFNPGQATEVSINKPGWEEERRPFTFTCLNDDPFL